MKFTLLLVLVNVVVFFYTMSNSDYFLENYGFSINSFLAGKYYLPITSIFLHLNLFHLISNMLALLFLGGAVESKIGGLKYLLVYLLSGIAGSLAAFVPIFGYSPDILFIGASGAISGIIGVGIFVSPGTWTLFPFRIIPVPFVIAAALYFILTTSLLFVEEGIAYPAHLTGMLTGMVFGLFWGEKRLFRFFLFIFVIGLILALPYILRMIL